MAISAALVGKMFKIPNRRDPGTTTRFVLTSGIRAAIHTEAVESETDRETKTRHGGWNDT